MGYQIKLNGQPREVREGISLMGLLSELQVSVDRVAIEVNMVIIEKERLSTTYIKEGDRIEIIGFVGGG